MPEESDKMKIFYAILQFCGFIALLIFLYFTVCNPSAHAYVEDKPIKGQWICWANSAKDSTCGTYGWDKYKKWAFKAAIDKCERHCNSQCKLEYCERAK
jgi:hypothetical protein